MPFHAEVNAETRTPQGVTIDTLYRSARCETMADSLRWVDTVTRALEARRSVATVTVTDDNGARHLHYQWRYDGTPRWCPGTRRRLFRR